MVKQFIAKWFAAEDLESFTGLARGEGKVVTFQDRKMALYKDDNGNLHAINPICTHLKCSVAWNAAERSWDCPCHGARYDADGEVLTGPADRNLEHIEVRDLLDGQL